MLRSTRIGHDYGIRRELSHIPFTWQVLPVLLGFRDYQVWGWLWATLVAQFSSRKIDTDSLIWRHKHQRGKILTYRKGVDGAADVKIRTVRAMKAEAREAAWAEDCHYRPSHTCKQRQLKDFLFLKAIPAA